MDRDMKKKALSEFDAQALSEIIKRVGRNSDNEAVAGEKVGTEYRIFFNEAQFQFALAWAIKEQFDCEVILEALTRYYENGDRKKRDYTDIVLEKGDLRIAIELKYKTAGLEMADKKISLANQGARDLGCYDFFLDIARIQTLTHKGDHSVLLPCDRGYAVFLTNDKGYWTYSEDKSTRIYRDFVFHQPSEADRVVRLKQGEHGWHKKAGETDLPKTVRGTSRDREINLDNELIAQWEDLYTLETSIGKNNEFKFLVFEIRPSSR